ncbi:hypothetical protein ACIBM3_15320 [Rhodococcus erythropolis]|uniref:hypothetical protein n=1 Tax=Rhodococcus erythropolis TaxID=1833 RepID=UPI0037B9037E
MPTYSIWKTPETLDWETPAERPTKLLRDYVALHPRADDLAAPLFPAMRLVAQKPTGLRATDANGKRMFPKPKMPWLRSVWTRPKRG